MLFTLRQELTQHHGYKEGKQRYEQLITYQTSEWL